MQVDLGEALYFGLLRAQMKRNNWLWGEVQDGLLGFSGRTASEGFPKLGCFCGQFGGICGRKKKWGKSGQVSEKRVVRLGWKAWFK